MENFYQLLKEYNIRFANDHSDISKWFYQYTEDTPPLYWRTVYDILHNQNTDFSITEIGAGYGDVTALLYYMGYRNIISFEMDKICCKYLKEKVWYLFGIEPKIINAQYPQKTEITPDILIQVNCVYAENLKSRQEYISQIKNFYETNGAPKMYLIEVIDGEYKEVNEIYPDYIRLNKSDVTFIFPYCKIQSYKTYQFPQNKTSKTLYSICV
jgi:protein-L-isoaspartate(D-aspartate) O-methyltransferase